MSQTLPLLDKDDPEVKPAIEALLKFRALTYAQIIGLVYGGNDKRGYGAIRRLGDARLIVCKRHPDNARVGYAHLTEEGVRAAGQDPARHIAPRRDRVGRTLAVNDIYVRLVSLGVPAEAITLRRDALDDLDVSPQQSLLAMQVNGVEKRWLLYLREKGVRKKILRSTIVVPGDLGHVVLYEENPARDIREYAQQSVPRDYHLLQMDDLSLFKTLAFEPESVRACMAVHMAARYPGRIVRLGDTPFDCAWEKPDGTRAILADASTNNVGPVKGLRDLNIAYARQAKWGQGAVLFARDEKSADCWFRVLGPRDWLRLVRYDLPPGKSFFQAGDKGWRPS